jgi:transposase-like protein
MTEPSRLWPRPSALLWPSSHPCRLSCSIHPTLRCLTSDIPRLDCSMDTSRKLLIRPSALKIAKRRSFTDDFKRKAVSLLTSSSRPQKQVATELGIQPSMLRGWRGWVNKEVERSSGAAAPVVAVTSFSKQAAIRRQPVAVNSITPALIRRINNATVFHALREHPGSSQRTLIMLTHLESSTVSNIIVRLQAEQIVRRVDDRRRGQAGRPEGVLEIDPDGGTFIGVAIEPECIRLIACGLDGGCRSALAVESGSTMGSTLAYLQRGIHTLVANLGANFDQVRDIGVGYHRLIDRYGHLVLAPRFGLRDIPLGTLLRGLFPVPVHLENNTKAATLAEYLFGACRDVDDVVLVHGGSGISGALYLQGTLYTAQASPGNSGT